MIREYYESRREMVDQHIKKLVKDLGLDIVSETVLGGKRLRGVLAVLVCEALGGKAEDALDAAAAVEIAHAASLDLDDIVDLDEMRRGKPATWIAKGLGRAVLGSHLLVSTSLRLVERYGEQAMRLVHRAYNEMVRGELSDIRGGSFYEDIIRMKTAPIWGAAAALGAIAAGAQDEVVGKAWDYGVSVGMAFQVADDMRDVLLAVDQGKLLKLLRNPSAIAFLAWLGVKALFERSPMQVLFGGLRSVIDRARETALKKLDEMVERAREAAKALPSVSNEWKKLLTSYPEFATQLLMEVG